MLRLWLTWYACVHRQRRRVSVHMYSLYALLMRFHKASSPLFYITALTALFESIAMIVDQHQPIVEKYYGPGKMTPVIERLLQESDRVVKDMIEGWVEERSMQRKVRM